MKGKQLKGFQGIFFEDEMEQQLIDLQKKKLDSNIKNMHITFKVGNIEKYPEELIEKNFKIKLTGYASDGKNSGFLVEIPKELRKFYKSSTVPYIAVSIGEVDGVKGRDIDTARLNFKPLKEHIEIQGKLGYFIFDKGICMDNDIINQHQKDNISQNVRVLLVPKYMNKEELSAANITPFATVEAEYGEKVINGEQITLAHHAKEYENNHSPCNTRDVPIIPDDSTIVINCMNLETLGGVAALMGRKKEDPAFWTTAEFIGLNGSHNLFQVREEPRKKYIAYQAYRAYHRNSRFTEITDITDIVLEHLEIIDRIIDGDKTLIQDGIKWYDEINRKIEECLVFENDNVRVFDSPNGMFCSEAFYSKKQCKVIPSTVTRNGKLKSITIAMADRGKKISVKELVQELWGNEAGGHRGIAGSPKGQEMTENDMKQSINVVNQYIINSKLDEPIYFEPDESTLDE